MLPIRVTCSLGLLALCSTASAQSFQGYGNRLAPYVVSPQETVDRMLEIANLKEGEVLYDLGSGDGRILISAAQRYRAKALGIEISEPLVRSTNERIRQLGLQNLASAIHGDLLTTDFSPADVVTLYLMTGSNETLRPKLERYLRRGARVVSHEYPVPGWKPKFVDKPDPYLKGHVIYLYVMPAQSK